MQSFLIAWLIIGGLVMPLTLWITAPFGRHVNDRFGPTMDNRTGWLTMESPAIWWFSLVLAVSAWRTGDSTQYVGVLYSIWMFHYLYRGLVFPWRIRTRGKRIPILIVLFAFGFQMINGFVNAYSLGMNAQQYDARWMTSPAFLAGAILFAIGWCIHFQSDNQLMQLRSTTETGYSVPHGGLFRWVSCPNFLGEMIQWCGWAAMCWNLAGLSFAVWTVANLLPRAWAHHCWYRQQFENYPKHRRAIFPWLL